MTATYSDLMAEWHDPADRVESIEDDDLRHAACSRMDEILAECAHAEHAGSDADTADLIESQEGWRY